MFKNYLKIVWRNFNSNKLYSLINITGLSIGLTCVILLSLFVKDETSFDSFHQNSSQIYSIGAEYSSPGNITKSLVTPFPLGATMKQEIPEIQDYLTTTNPYSGKISTDGEKFTKEEKVIAASSGFFSLFNFPLLAGEPNSVLESPGSAVITEKIAQKYFPNENPLGKTLVIETFGSNEYTITGIAKNPPKNTYSVFDVIYSIETLSSTRNNMNSWGSSMYRTYVRIQDGEDWSTVQPKLTPIIENNHRPQWNRSYFSLPIEQLYLSDLVEVSGFKGNYTYIYMFSVIGLFILLLASINYVNLSTARSMKRTLEVGVRKVMGASKTQLIKQFIGESILTTLLALLLAIFFAELCLPAFNSFFEKELSLNIIENSSFIAFLFASSILLGFISGLYPAFFLSSFNPSGILKGTISGTMGNSKLRKSLVVTQFTVSTILIICTLVVSNQLSYLSDKDLGFDKENILYAPISSEFLNKTDTFQQALESYQEITSTSLTNGVPGAFAFSMDNKFDPKNPEKEINAHFIKTDYKFKDVLGLNLIAGRFFDENRSTDSTQNVVINESMQKEMGWSTPEEAIGGTIDKDVGTVIGVVNDFHFKSLKESISPVLIMMPSAKLPFSGNDMLAIRYQTTDIKSLTNFIQEEWMNLTASTPLEFLFLDDQLNSQYRSEQKLGSAFSFFSIIAVFIACIGLLGLVAFATERRIKEIGIRKVLGASITNIVTLLSKEFLLLVFIGFLIAVPISWYFMNKWLSEFAYSINIGVGIFITAVSLVLFISLIITSWQSIKASLMNPVNSLKND